MSRVVHIPAESDEMLRASGVELKAWAKGRKSKRQEAAVRELQRRKDNKAAKRAAVASS